MNESFHEIYYPFNQQYFTWYCCHGFVNLLAANTFSLLLIFPVFAMLALTPRGISPPCKLVLAVSCTLFIWIPEISYRFEGIGFKLRHISNCIIKRSVVQNYTQYSCENPCLITTNEEWEHQNKARRRTAHKHERFDVTRWRSAILIWK